MTGSIMGSTATYSCMTNYTLVGPTTRECRLDVGWSGQDSLCSKLYMYTWSLWKLVKKTLIIQHRAQL